MEQTINGGFKKAYSSAREAKEFRVVPYDDELAVNFNPRWLGKSTRFSVVFKRSRSGSVQVKLAGKTLEDAPLEKNSRLIFGLTNTGAPFFCRNSESLRGVRESIRLCKILEISDSISSGVVAVLNDCLPGPQTPEKAKQASFVALDIRRGRFGQFDKRPSEKECVSILILTEFSHWEEKSQNMVKSSLDHNLVVDDALISEAIDEYEKAYGVDFLDRMTKEFFMSAKEARVIATKIVMRSGGKIFRDIEDGQYKRITYSDGAVIVTAK